MMWVAIALYVPGYIGLRALARDCQGGPVIQWWPRLCLIFWPFTVALGALGDLYDWLSRRRAGKPSV